MALLPNDYADRTAEVFGAEIAEMVSRQNEKARGLISDVGSQFAVAGSPMPVTPSDDDPVIDLGGQIRNEAFVCAPVEPSSLPKLTSIVAAAAGFTPQPLTDAVIFAHRAVDPGASTSRRVGLATFTGVLVPAISPSGDRVKLVVVDQTRARVLREITTLPSAPTLKKYFSRRALSRAERFDADVDAVYRRRDGQTSRAVIMDSVPVPALVPVSDGLVAGANLERVTLSRRSEPVPAGIVEPVGPELTIGDSSYGVVQSGLAGSDTTGPDGGGPASDPLPDSVLNATINGGLTDTAPAGLVWGDPDAPLLCSRASQDGCLGCCQTIAGRYYASALGAFTIGATTSGGAVLGFVTIPVAWVPIAVGAIVGGVIAVIGLIHGSLCERDCRTLYDRSTGKDIQLRRYQLTAAEVSGGERRAFRAEIILEDGTTRAATIPTNQLMSIIWGGGRVEIPTSGPGVTGVSLARRPGGGGFYLRSARNRKLTDNLRLLPEIVV